jgi:hypothetical protein
MLGFFKSPPFRDSILGEFARSRGRWRGKLELNGAAVPLVLLGERSEPDPQALALARTIATNFLTWRSVIEIALFEHYRPYAEALATGELPAPSDPVPGISTPREVWPHVTLVFASVTLLDRALAVELGFTTAWDEEHTLAARFQHGEFIELCGSVLPP